MSETFTIPTDFKMQRKTKQENKDDVSNVEAQDESDRGKGGRSGGVAPPHLDEPSGHYGRTPSDIDEPSGHYDGSTKTFESSSTKTFEDDGDRFQDAMQSPDNPEESSVGSFRSDASNSESDATSWSKASTPPQSGSKRASWRSSPNPAAP